FFEGLAGNGPDIDAVFQIADEIGQSALEMDDSSQNDEFVVQPPPEESASQDRPRARSFSGQGLLSTSAPGQPIQVRSNASEAGTDYSRSRRRSALLSIDTLSPAPQQSPLAQIYHPTANHLTDTSEAAIDRASSTCPSPCKARGTTPS
ncbi:1010_t:CDS:2, partial [Acaulospora colombiana]